MVLTTSAGKFAPLARRIPLRRLRGSRATPRRRRRPEPRRPPRRAFRYPRATVGQVDRAAIPAPRQQHPGGSAPAPPQPRSVTPPAIRRDCPSGVPILAGVAPSLGHPAHRRRRDPPGALPRPIGPQDASAPRLGRIAGLSSLRSRFGGSAPAPTLQKVAASRTRKAAAQSGFCVSLPPPFPSDPFSPSSLSARTHSRGKREGKTRNGLLFCLLNARPSGSPDNSRTALPPLRLRPSGAARWSRSGRG